MSLSCSLALARVVEFKLSYEDAFVSGKNLVIRLSNYVSTLDLRPRPVDSRTM